MKNNCIICKEEFEESEDGGIAQGYFGAIEISFCGYCLSSLYDMFDYLEKEKIIVKKEDHEI